MDAPRPDRPLIRISGFFIFLLLPSLRFRDKRLAATRTLQVFPINALVFLRAYAGATMRALRPERCADCYRVKLLAAGHCGSLASESLGM
jgi:hypothetical protein